MTKFLPIVASLIFYFAILCPGAVESEELPSFIKAGLERFPPDARSGISIAIADVQSRKILFAKDIDVPRLPASVLKIATTYSALKRLGGEYRFATIVKADPSLSGTALQKLCVEGGGDPALVTEKLPLFVAELKKRGVRSVDQIAVSAARAKFEPRSGLNPYQAARGAVLFNHNVVEISVAPTEPGKPALVTTLYPAPVKIRAAVNTVDGSNSSVSLSEDRPGQIFVSGTIGKGAPPWSEFVAVEDPSALLRLALKETLERSGISVKGEGTEPECSGTELFRIESDPLRQILNGLNRYSNNMLAHQVALALGSARTDNLELSAGLESIVEDISSLTPPTDLKVVDGSGLSKDNRVTARQLISVLLAAWSDLSIQPDFVSSFARYGSPGTLKSRKLSEGRTVWAKTGTLDGVSSLVGFLETRKGARIAFVILVNAPVSKPSAVEFEDRMVENLIEQL